MREINEQLKRSSLFVQAGGSRVKLGIPLAIVVYFALWLAGLAAGRALAALIPAAGNESAEIALRRMIVCATQIAVFFLWVRLIEKRSVSTVGFAAKRPFRSYGLGVVFGLLAITAITAVLLLSGTVRLQVRPGEAINLVLVALGWIVQSASEEIAVRGWLIPTLGNKSNPVAAICITALVFGVLHLFSSGVTVLSFVNLTLSGMFFAGYAIASGHIFGVCGLHFAWNLALGSIYGFPVSGYALNGDTVFSLQRMENNLLTGGSFGPEGGFAATALLLIALFILALVWRKKNKKRV